MPSLVDKQLFPALFRGVPFLIEESGREGGRKLAIHEIPNLDDHKIQDMGKQVPDFSITAIIAGQDDYILKRNHLIQALEQFGPGQLSHPFFGILQVHVKHYSLQESTANLGKCIFNIDFVVTSNSIYVPKVATGSPLIAAKVEAFQDELQSHINDTYEPSTFIKLNHVYNVQLVQSTFISLDRTASLVGAATAGLEPNLSQALSFFKNLITIPDYTAASASLFSSAIINGFSKINDFDSTSDVLYAGWKTCFNFRQNEPMPSVTTVQKLRNLDNHLLISGCVNMSALVYAYQEACGMTFTYSDQLKKVQNDLENQYQYILSIPKVDYDLLDQIHDIRSDALEYFNQLDAQVYKTTKVKINTIPLAVLTYQYYGSLENQDTLQVLNDIREPSFVSGDVRILTP